MIVNTEILKHPMNWITVFLMVFIFMMGVAFVTGHYRQVSNQHLNA